MKHKVPTVESNHTYEPSWGAPLALTGESKADLTNSNFIHMEKPITMCAVPHLACGSRSNRLTAILLQLSALPDYRRGHTTLL